MHDLAFADATRPTPAFILRVLLQPYSLGHELILLQRKVHHNHITLRRKLQRRLPKVPPQIPNPILTQSTLRHLPTKHTIEIRRVIHNGCHEHHHSNTVSNCQHFCLLSPMSAKVSQCKPNQKKKKKGGAGGRNKVHPNPTIPTQTLAHPHQSTHNAFLTSDQYKDAPEQEKPRQPTAPRKETPSKKILILII